LARVVRPVHLRADFIREIFQRNSHRIPVGRFPSSFPYSPPLHIKLRKEEIAGREGGINSSPSLFLSLLFEREDDLSPCPPPSSLLESRSAALELILREFPERGIGENSLREKYGREDPHSYPQK
jgi:hypothetical protein